MMTGTSKTAPVPPRVVRVLDNRPADELPVVRELTAGEFGNAAITWRDYHETTGNPSTDRIFCVFSEGE